MTHYGNQRRHSCRALLVSAAVSAALTAWSSGQLVASPWDGLPEEMMVALRIPNGQAFAEAIAADTKFGAVMFGEKKKAAVAAVLESGDLSWWSEFHEQLEEYGLTTDDLLGLFAGESGYAVVMSTSGEPTDSGQAPALAGLAWFEPGQELAGQFYQAIAQWIDEQDDEHSINRVDLTLGGQPVMQLQVPSMEIEYEDDFDVDEEYEDLPTGEKRAAWAKAYQQWQESAVETVVFNTVLVGILGDRMLVVHDYQGQDEAASASAAERLSVVFAQWIAANESGAEGIVAELVEDPGAARVMALEGVPLLEMVGNATPMLGLLRATAPSAEKAEQVVRILGLNGVGPFAVRSTLAGTRWSTNFSLAAPTPRQGLLQLLDQEPLAIDPPQWVPASAVQYFQCSFDLGRAYEIIKEEVIREFPLQASGGIALVENYVQNFAEASLSEVLSSLGHRHTVMSFGIESIEITPVRDDGPDDDELVPTSSERMAFVWQVEDEVMWARLLKAIAPFAGMMPGIEFTEEQGFSGWRMRREANEGGLFLGKSYLVLGFGSGVIESMLSSLSNPPSGSDALRGSKVYAVANTLIDLEPGLAVEITDGNRTMGMLVPEIDKQLKQFSQMLEQMGDDHPEDGDDENKVGKLILPLLRTILPSQDEIQGMMGVMAGRWEVNDDGLFAESVQEMPAP